MGCRAAPPRASRGRSAPSARRDGRAAAPLHAARHRGGASGARVDSAGSGWGRVDRGCSLTAHTDPGRKPGVNGRWLIRGRARGVSRVTDGCPHRRAVLALSPFAPRRAHDHRDRPADHHDGRELRMARRGARTRPAGGSDGRGRLERERRLSPRGHALGRTRTEDPCPAHRGSAALPGALTAGRNRGPATGTPRPRAAAHSVGAARGGRARARARDPRARARDPSHAARPAARPYPGAGRPLGAAPGVSRRAGPTAHRSQPHMKSLTLEHASFWYPATESPALRDVSLEVASGEVVALVGALGAGASTLLLVAGDLAPRVTGGRLEGTAARRDRSGIVLPTPWTQLSGMAFSVWDEVAFGPANLGWPAHEISRQVDRALERLELVPLAARDPVTLSGGELQRVIVAGLLAMDPDLMLLDQPTAELDPAGARSVWRLLRLLAGEGKAIVVATSELDAVPDVADQVVWLDDGAGRAIGTPQLLAEDAARGDGLGTAGARIWRAAGLAPPYPLTVADPVPRGARAPRP